MKVIKLTGADRDSTATFVNAASIVSFIHISKSSHTLIYTNAIMGNLTGTTGSILPFTISVKETPDQIIEMINKEDTQ